MENIEFEKIDELIRAKNYDSLTTAEQTFVANHMGGENAYSKLRSLVIQAQQEDAIPVVSSVKSDLVMKFKGKHQRSPMSWLNYKMPAYANALLILIAVLSVWYLKPIEQVIVDRPVTVQLPAKIDTLMIPSPADTIFIEKRIRVEVPVYITKTIESTKVEEVAKTMKGNALSNQQGLQELLVSGE